MGLISEDVRNAGSGEEFGVFAEVVGEAFLEAFDRGGGGGLGGDGLVEERGDEFAVGGGERGEPVLFHGVAFVAGEPVETFEIHDVRARGRGDVQPHRAGPRAGAASPC